MPLRYAKTARLAGDFHVAAARHSYYTLSALIGTNPPEKGAHWRAHWRAPSMTEHRSTIGAALLSAIALAWVSAASVVATATHAHWSDPIPLGLIAAGGLCLVGALIAFAGLPSTGSPSSPVATPVRTEQPIIAASAPDGDLVLEIEAHEKWDVWQSDLYIVEAPVRITNTTAKRKQLEGLPSSKARREASYCKRLRSSPSSQHV